ncbi:LCP family protein [Desulfitibacter alkalitolerans]|uniref:LCP family protein n=1 Tax=Desulfitibacter alkalitolerans TaxID=264641 RepID=UPI0006880621|nr:LCP family protein [Desulfitibacter alkalitolerans]
MRKNIFGDISRGYIRGVSPFLVAFIIFMMLGLLFFWYDSTQQQAAIENGEETEEEEEMIDPMNILILGLDVAKGSTGRTDTIMLLSFRPDRDEVYLMSIPRDTRVKIKGSNDKINAAYAYGGAELARKTIEEFLDIEIDHHIVLNYEAFVTLIDLSGGIEVDVPVRMYVPDENINLQPGLQKLDGAGALAYARFRGTTEGDLGRAKRQQEIIKLLVDELLKPKMVIKLPQIIQTMTDYVEHDFSTTELMKFAAAAAKAKNKPIESLILPGTNQKISGIWYYIANEKKLPEVVENFQ